MPYADPEDRRRQQCALAKQKKADLADVGKAPDVVDPDRREACKHDLRLFLTTYLANFFQLEFSPAHERLIAEIEQVILHGKRMVVAMPRGSGKTTIMMCAQLWAALYAHRRFPMLICGEDRKFKNLLAGLKVILETNDLLLEDFPEVCQPIRALERVPLRANFQRCHGEPTYVKWSSDLIVFPTTPYTIAAGNAGTIITGGGLTGSAVRGGVVVTPSGDQVRPDCVLIDDPQTHDSAKSPSQCEDRMRIINGDILGMAGPGKDIAALVTCTVIYVDDVADRLLNPELSPAWARIRVKMLDSFPKNLDLWEQYADLDRQEVNKEIEQGTAHKFYVDNREEMDEGCSVYWEARVKPRFASAIESAMIDWLRDPGNFQCEYQNEPEERLAAGSIKLRASHLTKRIGVDARGVVPTGVSTLTAHVDVQGRVLFWMVCGFDQNFRCHIIDYGTTPNQNRGYFTLHDLRRTYHDEFPGNDEGGALRAAIQHTIKQLGTRTWQRTDGTKLQIARGLVDARWSTEDVEAGIELAAVPGWMPAYGVGCPAGRPPLTKFTTDSSAMRGFYWLAFRPPRRQMVSAFYDISFWKTDAYRSLADDCAPTHRHATTLFKDLPSKHQMMADHFAAEAGEPGEAKGKIIYDWKLQTSGHDNHWWDNFVGCRAAASMCGVRKSERSNPTKPKPKKRRVSRLKT